MKRAWDPSSSVSYQINLAYRLLAQENEARLRPLEIGAAYIPVLASLANIGPMTQKELAQAARVDQSTMTMLLNRMEKAGLIVRSPSPNDGRAILVELSIQGKARIPESKVIVEETAKQALRGFSGIEKQNLRSLLQKLISNLETRKADDES